MLFAFVWVIGFLRIIDLLYWLVSLFIDINNTRFIICLGIRLFLLQKNFLLAFAKEVLFIYNLSRSKGSKGKVLPALVDLRIEMTDLVPVLTKAHKEKLKRKVRERNCLFCPARTTKSMCSALVSACSDLRTSYWFSVLKEKMYIHGIFTFPQWIYESPDFCRKGIAKEINFYSLTYDTAATESCTFSSQYCRCLRSLSLCGDISPCISPASSINLSRNHYIRNGTPQESKGWFFFLTSEILVFTFNPDLTVFKINPFCNRRRHMPCFQTS